MTEPRNTSTPYIQAQGGDAWAKDATTMGKTGTQRLLAVDHGPPEPAIKEALELSNEAVVVRKRLILADGTPVELAQSYYPASIAAGTDLATPKKIKGGAVAALTATGHAIIDVTEVVDARLPDSDEAQLLNVDISQPVLVLTRVGRDATGRPVECAINIMIPGRAAPISYHYRTQGAA